MYLSIIRFMVVCLQNLDLIQERRLAILWQKLKVGSQARLKILLRDIIIIQS